MDITAAIFAESSTATQRRLLHGEEKLIRLYVAIRKIASLEQWRLQHDAQITDWWWYLDVIAQMSKAFQVTVTPVYHYDSRRALEMAIRD